MKKQNALLGALQNVPAYTGNGALSFSTTKSKVLDFFGKGGAARNRPDAEVIAMFDDAFSEEPILALKVLFYLADVRGGQGERRLFRICYNWLAKNQPAIAKKLLQYIPEYTRWDNILESLEDTALEKDGLKFLASKLLEDVKSELPSLAGKWAPSEQASSKTTKRLAEKVRKTLNLSPRTYRKLLSNLRNRIGVVERLMCSRDWSEINFEHVPSRAALLYKSAFSKHTPELYQTFIKKVQEGKAKINASTLYPYDIMRELLDVGVIRKSASDIATLQAQWSALPNYLADNPHNGLVIADVSGSMYGGSYYGGNEKGNVRPIDVCISLAIYFAERNEGAFKNHFLTFSDDSKLVKLRGSSLQEKVDQLARADWGGSTNVQSAFKQILEAAVRDSVPAKEMPSVVYIISDMQFNSCVSGTNLAGIKAQYKKAGYELPTIVFWQVNAYADVPVQANENGFVLVSGCSPSILKSVLTNKTVTPFDFMLETVLTKRYEPITA